SFTSGSRGILGPYAVLAHGYDPSLVAAWLRNDLAVLGLVVAVAPLAALPLGLAACFRRSAPQRHRALGVVTLVILLLVYVQVSIFSSTAYGLGRVHERYLFYVAPLVFCVFAVWIDLGLPRPRRPAVAIAAVVALLPLLLPTHGFVPSGVD